jgi:hypothetical protein
MNSKSFYSVLLLPATILVVLCISISCSKNVKADAKPETEILPIKKNSDRFRNKLSQKAIEDYLANTAPIKTDRNYKVPFNIEFDKVIAYDYDGEEEAFPSVISREGHFIQIIDKQIALNKGQVDNLVNDILTSNSTYGGSTAACFQPHLGIVFFNKSERVFVVDICLGCNYLSSSKLIPATEFHKFKFEGEEKEYSSIGFSEKGKKKIRYLAKELDLFYGK